MNVETDVIRQVYEADEGHFITVRPWAEAPNTVCMQTVGKENQDWFGRFEPAMSPEFARQLGMALIACANEVEKK